MLSDDDLRAIADRMGLGLPPELERLFVVEEILEALEEDKLERIRGSESPVGYEDAKCWSGDDGELASDNPPRLDARYNETMIKALVRDPSWAFAFWDIAEADLLALDPACDSCQLFLRVAETGERGDERPGTFDIPVAREDFQWYINLPRPEATYRIDLAVRSGTKVRVLARSMAIAVPRQHGEFEGLDGKARRLLELSGVAALDIVDEVEENPARILRDEPVGRGA